MRDLWRRCRSSTPSDDDRGSAALSAAILGLVLLLLPMMLVQAAMYFHSRSLAASAGRHGLEATRVATGSTSAGEAAAQQYLAQAGGPLTGTGVSAARSGTTATVTVTGDVTSVVPGIAFDVSVTVTGPVERFEP